MRDTKVSLGVGPWLAVSLLMSACATPSIGPQPLSLVGSWDLLTAVSELPVGQPASVTAGASWGEGSGHDPSLDALRAALMFAMEPPRRLSITQTRSSVWLTADGGQQVLLHTDGRPSEDLIAGSSDCQCHAMWRGDVLFVEQVLEGRTHVVQTYAPLEDGRRLLVTVRLRDNRLPHPLTSVRAYGAS